MLRSVRLASTRSHRFASVWAAWMGLILTLGCSGASNSYVWAAVHPSLSQPPSAHQLGPSDKIAVVVQSHEELSGEHTISAEGRYAQPLIGTLSVRGMTTPQVEELVKTRLSAFVTAPRVSVTLLTARLLRVNALGEVKQPGQFTVDRNETVLDVLGRAGGLTDFADDSAIYLVRTQPTERIRFRYEDLTRPDATLGFRLQDGDSIIVE